MKKEKAKRFCVKIFKKLKRKKQQIPAYQYKELLEQLIICKKAIQATERTHQQEIAQPESLKQPTTSKAKAYKQELAKLESLYKRILPVSRTVRLLEWFAGLIGALLLALIIRSMLFEAYKVPTGSMRPTLKEQDLLLVNKSNFGINIPFINKHLLFDPNLIKRLSITVLSGWGLDIPDNKMKYFFVFPGIKQYIKRLIARPGDWVYFYGGKIYAIDAQGNDLKELRDSSVANRLTWVPYIYMDGKKRVLEFKKGFPEISFSQMNIPILKAWVSTEGFVLSEFFNGRCWAMNFVTPYNAEKRQEPTEYRDLWGLGNYATVRLLKPDEKEKNYSSQNRSHFDHQLYMEIYSLPSIRQAAWQIVQGKVPVLIPNQSYIPLNQTHLQRLMKNMYTSRFVVSKGKAYRYNMFAKGGFTPIGGIELSALSEGTYEFEAGVCYRIDRLGNRTAVAQSNGIYSTNVNNVYNLFNFGVTFDEKALSTMRYCFYNLGDLYALNGVLFDKDDPYLKQYVEWQIKQENIKKKDTSFYPFIDLGPPIKNGEIDKEFIKAFGLQIPKDSYLMLGDNYAMSADSRDFGFVKSGNLRGTASYIFWPTSSMGVPLQPTYPWFTFPKALIWIVAIFIFLATYYIRRVHLQRDFDQITLDL